MITNEMRPHFSSSRHKEITLLIAQLSALKPMYSLGVSIIVSRERRSSASQSSVEPHTEDRTDRLGHMGELK